MKDVYRSCHTKPLKSVLTNNAEKVKKSVTHSSVGDHVDFFDITCTLRKNIVEWLNAREDMRLRMLKEHTDYEIQVTPSETQTGGYTVAVMCQMCDEKKHLSTDKKGCIKLSNWYRHVKTCINKKRTTPNNKLAHYFPQKSKMSMPPLKNSPLTSVPGDISKMTSNEITTGIADEVLTVAKDEASIPAITFEISSDNSGVPDPTSVITSSQPDKPTASSTLAIADEMLTIANTSVLEDGSSSVLSSANTADEVKHEENQVFWVAPPITKQ